jgi:hypothetical protein
MNSVFLGCDLQTPNIHDNVNVASHQIGRDAFYDMMMIPHIAEGDGLHTSAAVRPRTCATTPTYVSLSVYAYFTRCCSRLLFSPPHQPQRKPATHGPSLTRSELVCIHQRSPVDCICICVCRTAVAVVQQLGGLISQNWLHAASGAAISEWTWERTARGVAQVWRTIDLIDPACRASSAAWRPPPKWPRRLSAASR